MEQSVQVLEWQAAAERRGFLKGMTAGWAESLLRVLGWRFSTPVPADLATTIQTTRDIAQLDRWFDAALDVATLEAFRRLVQP